MRNEGGRKMANAEFLARTVVINVFWSLKLAAILKHVFLFQLHSSQLNR